MQTTYSYDHYYDYDEMTSHLHALANAYPSLLQMESICKSEKDKDVWAITLTNTSTGQAKDKPAFYIDANTHAGEVVGSMAAMHTIDVICTNYGIDPTITSLLDSTTIYVIPRISVDGTDVYLHTPYRLRSADRPYPFDLKQEGLVSEDIDQDGVIRMMRFKDKHGAWKINPDDPMVMIKRAPDEKEGEFYTVLSEGMLHGTESDEIQAAKPLWGLDFNRNYPYGWFNESRQPGAGPYPLSNIENKAVVDFVLDHPNIGCVATHHTSGGVILYPPGTRPEKSAHAIDMLCLKTIGAMATQEMGYPVINIFDHFMIDQENYSSGAFDDWCFQNQGIPAYTLELWNLLERAGSKIDWDRQGKLSDQEQIQILVNVFNWVKTNAPQSLMEWYEFDHPQLGKVEIGGLDLKFTSQNCPNQFLLQEVEKTTKFCLRYANVLPQLEIEKVDIDWISDDIVDLKVKVGNNGYLPTYLTQEAKSLKVDHPVHVTLSSDNITLLEGKLDMEIGDLEGYSSADATYHDCDYQTGHHLPMVKTIHWIIKTTKGTSLTITASQEKSGVVSTTVIL